MPPILTPETLAPALVAETGEAWTVTVPNPTNNPGATGVTHPDGWSLLIRDAGHTLASQNRARVFPFGLIKTASGRFRWLGHDGTAAPTIGLSILTPPDRAARAIARRLLPEVRKAWAEFLARIDEETAFEALTRETCDAMINAARARAYPAPRVDYNHDPTAGAHVRFAHPARAHVRGTRVRFEALDCNADTAVKIAALLAGEAKQ